MFIFFFYKEDASEISIKEKVKEDIKNYLMNIILYVFFLWINSLISVLFYIHLKQKVWVEIIKKKPAWPIMFITQLKFRSQRVNTLLTSWGLVYLFIHLTIYLSIYLSIYNLSIYVCIHLSIYPSYYLYTYTLYIYIHIIYLVSFCFCFPIFIICISLF